MEPTPRAPGPTERKPRYLSMVLLRFIAISLLILIALRLLGRLMSALFAQRTPRPATSEPRPTAREPVQRQLEPCPHCGTYFDPERSLKAPQSPELRFCSPACLEAHAIEAPSTGEAKSPHGDESQT